MCIKYIKPQFKKNVKTHKFLKINSHTPKYCNVNMKKTQ